MDLNLIIEETRALRDRIETELSFHAVPLEKIEAARVIVQKAIIDLCAVRHG